MNKKDYGPNSLVNRAYLRDGKITHTGLAVLLATIAHATGTRGGKEYQDLLSVMQDPNL